MTPLPAKLRPDAASTDARRRRAARTAWAIGALALAIYVGFILSGVLLSQ